MNKIILKDIAYKLLAAFMGDTIFDHIAGNVPEELHAVSAYTRDISIGMIKGFILNTFYN